MACRDDIKIAILNKVDKEINKLFTVEIKGRHTYYRVNQDTFRIANKAETRGKSKADTLEQAGQIAVTLQKRLIEKYGNNLYVTVVMPEYVGLPVEVKVSPKEHYVEKLFAQVEASKRTEPISRLAFLQDPALFQQELIEDQGLKMVPYEAWLAQQRQSKPIVDETGQIKFFQRSGDLATLSESEIDNLQNTVTNQLIVEQDDDLITKGGQSYVYLNEKDADRFSFILEKTKEFPKEFKVTKKITRYEKVPNSLSYNSYNEYVDFYYMKLNNNKKSNLYEIVNKETGEVVADKVRVLHLSKDSKSKIAEQYGLEFKPTKVFSANRSIAFGLYRQKPSKTKYIAQAKKYLYDAIKFLNPQDSNLKINLEQIERFLESFPDDMWDYINTTYSPEDSTNINASIGLQNKIRFKLPKLGLLTEIEKITGKKLQGVSFKNYDRSGTIKKVLDVDWGKTAVIDYKTMTTKELRTAIDYYLETQNYYKPSSEEQNLRKYAEHHGHSYEFVKQWMTDDDFARGGLSQTTAGEIRGESDSMYISKVREYARNYNWQSVELFQKPYENFQKTAKERITSKFKDKTLSNGISHLDYFFSGNFNWLNINFNNISGTYYEADMETETGVGVEQVVLGIVNPFVKSIYTKPEAGKNFLQEKEVFNRLAAILHEPFHALHALSYGTPEELELKKAFDNLYNTNFGKEMMNQVFGSGYNKGQKVSYDTLYKEFTAFSTQLMLYPKQWINDTDLRSNDIAEFILKIQTLQDKTYTEIVRTQQKIGTVEKTITEEEQIKLSFLEKLYNYLVKALQRVIPLSKKFLQILPESNIVSKQVIEDVFGTVEEEVTKTLKLPENVKKSKEEFLQAMEELKSAINTLMQIDSTLFSSDNVINFFTSDRFNQEAQSSSTTEVKPGVQELFDSNPELANQVYEAAGFDNLIKPTDKIIWGHPTIGKTTAKQEKDFLDFDTDFKPLVAKKLGLPESQQNSLGLNEWRKTNSEEDFNKAMREVWNIAKTQAKNQNKILMVSDMIFLRENQSDFDKIINIPSTTFINRAAQRGDNKENLQSWKDKIDQTLKNVDSKKIITTNKYLSDLFITPQQKQQTLQLYSQYLDTIFPDSKVKDIVYRADKRKDLTAQTTIDDGTLIFVNGVFYTSNFNYANNYNKELKGKIYHTIIDAINPIKVDKDEIQYFGRNKSEFVEEYPKNDSLIHIEDESYGIQDRYGFVEKEIVIFEPEQIHILGSTEDINEFKEFVKTGGQLSLIQLLENPITEVPDVMATIIYQNENCK